MEDRRGIGIVAGGLSLALLVGSIAYFSWNAKRERLRKIAAVHSYVQAHGTLTFQHQGQSIDAFADNGLGFEFNRSARLRDAAYELAVQGASKFTTDVVKNSLGIRREGDRFSPDFKALPEYSDSVVDRELDGLDREDVYRQWKYEPTLVKERDKGYASKIKGIATVARDVVNSVRGKEVDVAREEIVINRTLAREEQIGALSYGKKDSLAEQFNTYVDSAFNALPSTK